MRRLVLVLVAVILVELTSAGKDKPKFKLSETPDGVLQQRCKKCPKAKVIATKHMTICEDELQNISCPKGHQIKVMNSFYGRYDVLTCRKRNAPETVENTRCYKRGPSSSLPTIKSRCDNHQICEVSKPNQWLEDPCPGTYKYMTIMHTCVNIYPEQK